MTIVLGVFALLCLFGLRFSGFNKNYIDRKSTVQINGIFVFLVLLSHFCGYYGDALPIPFSTTYLEIRRMLAQLVVTTFLFFSGYGIMESIKRKGSAYVNNIPLKVIDLINSFVIAILMYVLLNLYIGRDMSVSQVLLSFIGWESIGNSNWYLFDILGLYLLTFASFKMCDGKPKPSILLNLVLMLGFMWFVGNYRSGMRWYNTLLCYWAGMLYSYNKAWIDQHVMRNAMTYLCTGAVLIGCFIYTYHRRDAINYYIAHAIFFSFIVCWAAMIVQLKSPILTWLGDHIFGIYILQRIPMLLGKHWGWMQSNPIFYGVFCFLATMLLAILFAILLKHLSIKKWIQQLKSRA